MVVPVVGRPLGPGRFAIEGPFAHHLRTLREMMADEVDEIVVAGVHMSDATYERRKATLGELDAATDRVSFVPLYPEGVGRAAFWTRCWPRAFATIAREVGRAGAVHASPSADPWKPTEVASLAAGAALGRTTVSVTDIDNRESGRMLFRTGRWSKSVYFRSRYFYEPIRDLQHRWIARACDLVLFKGDALMRDYGEGRHNVKPFHDPGFESEQVVDEAFVDAKVARVQRPGAPLRLLYFGRYVFYKGVHHMIEAFAKAGRADLELTLIGVGDMETELRALVASLDLGECVRFVDPMSYDALLVAIRDYDVLLAAPLGVDTPRSTWDAFAAAMPVLAYDTEFYESFGAHFGCVDVVRWNDVDALAAGMARLVDDRARVAAMSRAAAKAARENTQTSWLERRVAWTREAMARRR